VKPRPVLVGDPDRAGSTESFGAGSNRPFDMHVDRSSSAATSAPSRNGSGHQSNDVVLRVLAQWLADVSAEALTLTPTVEDKTSPPRRLTPASH